MGLSMTRTIRAKDGSRASSQSMVLELTGWERVTEALTKAQPHLRDATVPVMEELVVEIRDGARARLKPDHPRNLFRVKGSKKGSSGLYPTRAWSYRAYKKGPYLFGVQGVMGAAGRKQVLAEFAEYAITPQGAALARALDSIYGPPGRVLWHEADRIAPTALGRIREAVDKAAKEIEKDMGGA